MIIYLDKDYHCHLEAGEGCKPFDVPDFDAGCKIYVEGWQYIPNGESWTSPDGKVVSGSALTCIGNLRDMLTSLAQYNEDETAHIAELGALIEEIYNEDMEVIG